MRKHELVRLGEMKMAEADEWRRALLRHTEEYYRTWLLERFMGRLLDLSKGKWSSSTASVLLTRIHIDAHDARLDAEVNLETSKKLITSSELAARIYFEEHEQQWT